MARPRMSQDEFIKRCKKEHGERYSYKRTIYSGAHKTVKVKCRLHGYFEQAAHNHMRGYGCHVCGGGDLLTQKQFIDRSKAKHGELYDYSNSVYKRADKKVLIYCKEHGYFRQTASDHMRGAGCYYCGIILNQANNQKYARKPYKLGKRIIELQGWEPQALDYIQKRLHVKPNEILVGTDVPRVYYFNTKKRIYFPDFYIPSQNRIVEVKSTHTFNVSLETLKLKRKAVIKAGYIFSVIVLDKNISRVKLDPKWYAKSELYEN